MKSLDSVTKLPHLNSYRHSPHIFADRTPTLICYKKNRATVNFMASGHFAPKVTSIHLHFKPEVIFAPPSMQSERQIFWLITFLRLKICLLSTFTIFNVYFVQGNVLTFRFKHS